MTRRGSHTSGSTPKVARQSAAEARAEMEAEIAERKAVQDSELVAAFADGIPGHWLLQLGNAATALFVLATMITAFAGTKSLLLTTATIDLVLFVVGTVAFIAALYLGAQRSRDSSMTMSGWWFLTGSAPRSVRRTVWANTTLQTVIALVGASMQPFTPLAFGVLVPVLGLAVGGLWSARHGMFPKRKGVE